MTVLLLTSATLAYVHAHFHAVSDAVAGFSYFSYLVILVSNSFGFFPLHFMRIFSCNSKFHNSLGVF